MPSLDVFEDAESVHIRYTITFAGRLGCSATDAWSTLTRPGAFHGWVDQEIGETLEPGTLVRMDMAPSDFGASGVVVRCAPGRRLAIVVGRSIVDLTIEPTAAGCAYRLVQTGSHSNAAAAEGDVIDRWRRALDALADDRGGGALATAIAA